MTCVENVDAGERVQRGMGALWLLEEVVVMTMSVVHISDFLCICPFVKVSKVREKTSARELSLQARIQDMEAEKSRKENELKQLKQSKISVRPICSSLHLLLACACFHYADIH